MCIGKKPPTPKPQPPAPTMKSPAPPPQYVKPEDIKDDQPEDEKLSDKRRKALEIKAAQEGTGQLSAEDPGINTTTSVTGNTNIP